MDGCIERITQLDAWPDVRTGSRAELLRVSKTGLLLPEKADGGTEVPITYFTEPPDFHISPRALHSQECFLPLRGGFNLRCTRERYIPKNVFFLREEVLIYVHPVYHAKITVSTKNFPRHGYPLLLAGIEMVFWGLTEALQTAFYRVFCRGIALHSIECSESCVQTTRDFVDF